VQYMLAFISIKNGNIPFAYIRRRRLNFTMKQHIQMELLLTGVIIGGMVILIGIYWYAKLLIASYKKAISIALNRYRLKRSKLIIKAATCLTVSSYTIRLTKLKLINKKNFKSSCLFSAV